MAELEVPARLVGRNDIAQGWINENPTLLCGELGLETDTGKIKFGDGKTAWVSLPYFSPAAYDIPISPVLGMVAKTVQEAIAENFQSVVDGKSQVETAINDKGEPVNKVEAIPTFAELCTAISGIKTSVPENERVCKITLDNYAPPGEINNLGQLEPLSQARRYFAATTVGELAIFAGGNFGSALAVADAYSKTGAKTTLTNLSQARHSLAAAAVGEMAIFAGGASSSANSAVVDAYSKTGARATLTSLSQARYSFAAATVGELAIFAGGSLVTANSAVVDAYSKTGARATLTSLSQARYSFAAATVGEMAIFAGGYSDANSAVVDAYSKAGVRTTLTSLSQARNSLSGTTVGELAIFAGGYPGGANSAVVDAYSKTGARTTLTNLSQGRNSPAATAVGWLAIFAGGHTSNTVLAVVDAYSKAGARTTLMDLSQANKYPVATTVGELAIFTGDSTVVDAYGEKKTAEIPILGGGRYDFGSGESVAPGSAITVNLIAAQTPVNGYIEYKGATISG